MTGYTEAECLCELGEPCHFHSWVKARCLVCGWRFWAPSRGTVPMLCNREDCR